VIKHVKNRRRPYPPPADGDIYNPLLSGWWITHKALSIPISLALQVTGRKKKLTILRRIRHFKLLLHALARRRGLPPRCDHTVRTLIRIPLAITRSPKEQPIHGAPLPRFRRAGRGHTLQPLANKHITLGLLEVKLRRRWVRKDVVSDVDIASVVHAHFAGDELRVSAVHFQERGGEGVEDMRMVLGEAGGVVKVCFCAVCNGDGGRGGGGAGVVLCAAAEDDADGGGGRRREFLVCGVLAGTWGE